MVASFHDTQSICQNKSGLPDHLWVLRRALEGRSGRTERSKGAQGRIMYQHPENRAHSTSLLSSRGPNLASVSPLDPKFSRGASNRCRMPARPLHTRCVS